MEDEGKDLKPLFDLIMDTSPRQKAMRPLLSSSLS